MKAKTDRQAAVIESWRKDFIGFAKKLDVIDKNGERIPVEQSAILLEFEENRTGRDYVLKARQVYMTTWELCRDIWFFLVNPNAKVVVLCQSSNDNSGIKELSKRIVVMFEGLRRNYPDAPFVKYSDTRWGRTDGGTAELTIVGAGATEKAANKKGRAGTINRLHVTEVSFFEFAFETLNAMLACIPPDMNRTEITFESTPKGAAGAFFEGYMAAKEGKTEFHAHFFPWFMQPEYKAPILPGEIVAPKTEREKQLITLHGISLEQLKWYQQRVADPMKGGQAKVDQEFPSDEESCWLFDGRLFFDKDALHRLRTKSAEAADQMLSGACRIWIRPEVGKTYVVVIDPSSGSEIDETEAKKKDLDPCAVVVLERESGRHCATLHGYFHPDEIAAKAAALGWVYNIALIACERSSSHGQIHTSLQKWVRLGPDNRPDEKVGIGYPNIYVAEDRHYGFAMTPQSRPAVLDGLEVAIRLGDKPGGFVTRDLEFIKEAQLFIVKEDKPQAASGAHDDRIIATAIAWKLIQVPLGLKASAFMQPPSIAFERTPASFENMNGSQGINSLIESEQRRWAGGAPETNSGWATLLHNNGDTEGF